MKTTHPTLRVSNLTYVRVMSALLDETSTMAPEDALILISAIRAYLASETALPLGGEHDEILRRYRDIIDRAALRSSRARAAALARRKATEAAPEVPAEVPEEAPTEVPVDAPAEILIEVPSEVPAEAPAEAEVPTETRSIQNSKSQIQNSSVPSIPNSKSQIQNSAPSPSRPRIKIKHQSSSRKSRAMRSGKTAKL